MKVIKDDRGYNQIFAPTQTLMIRTQRRCNLIIEHLAGNQDLTILEVGCGQGEISYLLAKKTGASVLGTDICNPFIFQAKKNYSLVNLSYEALDFKNAPGLLKRQFDNIVGNGILHHLYEELDDSLLKMFNLLKPGGRIIFWEPNIYNPYCLLIFKNSFFRKKARLDPGEMAFSAKFIENKLRNAQFINISVQFRDFLLPNTLSLLIKPLIAAGTIAEKIPLLKYLSQSIFIVAEKKR